MSDLVTMSLDEVHAITTRILVGHGVSQDQTRAIANTVTNAERDDCSILSSRHDRPIGRVLPGDLGMCTRRID